MPYREDDHDDPIDDLIGDDDEIYEEDPCQHCVCYIDHGTCCDCGLDNLNSPNNIPIYPSEVDTIYPPLVISVTDDDGSEELKD